MINKFKFRLDNVLSLKRDEEDELRKVYMNKNQEKIKIEENINTLKSNYKKYSNANTTLDITTQKITLNYLSVLDKSISDNKELLNQKNIEIISAKDNFINKRIEKKSIEKLRENKEREYIRSNKLKEQVMLDELSMIGYIRKQNISKGY